MLLIFFNFLNTLFNKKFFVSYEIDRNFTPQIRRNVSLCLQAGVFSLLMSPRPGDIMEIAHDNLKLTTNLILIKDYGNNES